MQTFLNATDVTLNIPLQDANGNALAPTAVSYRVTDQSGVEKVASTPVASFTLGDTSVDLTIPALANTVVSPREMRVVTLSLTVGGNTVVILDNYVVQLADPLVTGVNSFQSYQESLLTALEMASLTGWNAASVDERVNALIEARHHINQLSFSVLGTTLDQSNIDYSFGSSTEYIGDLRNVTASQFVNLPVNFKRALQLAQVAEADAILGGDATADKRRSGLLAETVGESKQMFQSGKPLDLPVSKRAIGFLKSYVSYTVRAGR